MKFIQGEDSKKTKKFINNEKGILKLVASFCHRPILAYLTVNDKIVRKRARPVSTILPLKGM